MDHDESVGLSSPDPLVLFKCRCIDRFSATLVGGAGSVEDEQSARGPSGSQVWIGTESRGMIRALWLV